MEGCARCGWQVAATRFPTEQPLRLKLFTTPVELLFCARREANFYTFALTRPYEDVGHKPELPRVACLVDVQTRPEDRARKR